ncbi:MAG: ABC transporter substrate-binding protein, partial [Flavobacteriaceae bacterium]|nr:ABC transporter substrate-binding protein [Flavobacteriaceae bacterium]
KGLNCRIVQTYVSTPLNWGIHVASASSFQKIEDLNHRTAAISRLGSGSHLMSFLLAQNYRWNTNDLQFKIVNDIHGAEKALTDKCADYFLWEKAMTQPLVDKGVFRRIGLFQNNWPAFVIVVRSAFLKQHTQAIESLLQTINNYTVDFNLIPSIDTSIAAFYELPLSDVQDWLGNTQFSEAAVSPQLIDEVQTAYKNIGMLNTVIAFDKILTNV